MTWGGLPPVPLSRCRLGGTAALEATGAFAEGGSACPPGLKAAVGPRCVGDGRVHHQRQKTMMAPSSVSVLG